MSRQMISALLCVVSVAGCSKPVEIVEQSQNRPVKLHQVQDGQQKLIRQFPAIVEPTENARLTFRVSGKLTEFTVRPGQEVKKGQVLFRISNPQFSQDMQSLAASVAAAESAVATAELQVTKTKPLVDQGIISAFELKNVEGLSPAETKSYFTVSS